MKQDSIIRLNPEETAIVRRALYIYEASIRFPIANKHPHTVADVQKVSIKLPLEDQTK